MLIAAFIMGLVGSLHCAVMCGPLTLAIPVAGTTPRAVQLSRAVYNTGRIAVYALLGLVFGAIGKSFLLVGIQQWLSILAGIVMIGLLVLRLYGNQGPLWRGSFWVKSIFRTFLGKRSFLSLFILGAANGLLPCGLVYMASAASASTGDPLKGAVYMATFGLGTLPMMLGLASCRAAISRILKPKVERVIIPAAVMVVALSLILRGMALGIPYLSPSTANAAITCPACITDETAEHKL